MRTCWTRALALLLCLALCGCGAQGDGSAAGSNAEDVKAAETSVSENPEETAQADASLTEEPEDTLTVEDVDALPAGTVLTAEELAALDTDSLFHADPISDEVFQRMDGVSFGEGCVVSREELRYVRVLHTGFDGETHIGELVCNEALAEDMVAIFQALYEAAYPIEKMHLIDDYGGDDEASMADNNTSCFNFRTVSGSDTLSWHAYGRAIDINPLYNPYVTSDGYEPSNAGAYVDRTAENPYAIDPSDLCCQLFAEHGFAWGGYWTSVQDYQHFEK